MFKEASKSWVYQPNAASWYLNSLFYTHDHSDFLFHGCNWGCPDVTMVYSACRECNSHGSKLPLPECDRCSWRRLQSGQLCWREANLGGGVLEARSEESLGARLVSGLLLRPPRPIFQYKVLFGSSGFTGLEFRAGLWHLLFISHLGSLRWQSRWKGCG